MLNELVESLIEEFSDVSSDVSDVGFDTNCYKKNVFMDWNLINNTKICSSLPKR